jgi:hypothetical protein
MMESKYWKLLVTSLILAFDAFFGPGILDRRDSIGAALFGPSLSIAWLLIVAYAFQQHKRRALWFLLAAPIAMFWPLGFALIALGVIRM